VDGHGGGKTSFSSEFPDWERELIEKVAARFRDLDRQELEAELAATLLEEKRRRRAGISNWKGYLWKALYNRATTLVRKLRAQQRREMSLDLHPGLADRLFDWEEAGLKGIESREALSELRRKLDGASYALLKLWGQSGGNESLVARLSGKHRNTIHRRLQRIWAKIGCPIENVSGCLRVTARQRKALVQLAHDPGAPARDGFKARLILALAAGQSYDEITRRFNTTAPTIARWKQRFEESGVRGLTPRHHGRKPRARTRMAIWLHSAGQATAGSSYRRIAHAAGISKSTVHRILKPQRFSHPS
jgi:transposase